MVFCEPLSLAKNNYLADLTPIHLGEAQGLFLDGLNPKVRILSMERQLLSKKEKIPLQKEINKLRYKSEDFKDWELRNLITSYKSWLSQNSYLTWFLKDENQLIFHRCSKRGNSVYSYYLKDQLEEQLLFMEDPNFSKKFALRKENKKGGRPELVSNIIFLTLTWNTNLLLGHKKRSWLSFEYFYNKFITQFRKKYGKCWVLKSVQSTKKGYPHGHLLIVCENPFKVFKHNNEFRIQEKNKIAKYWNANIDILVPRNIGVVKDYIVKDQLQPYTRGNTQRTDHDFLSLALSWVFRKRSFSISSFDSIDLRGVSVTQTQLEHIKEEFKEKEVIFLGIAHIEFVKKQKPPDKFISDLSFEELQQFLSNRKYIDNLKQNFSYDRFAKPKKDNYIKCKNCDQEVEDCDYNFKSKSCDYCLNLSNFISFPEAKEYYRTQFILDQLNKNYLQKKKK